MCALSKAAIVVNNVKQIITSNDLSISSVQLVVDHLFFLKLIGNIYKRLNFFILALEIGVLQRGGVTFLRRPSLSNG